MDKVKPADAETQLLDSQRLASKPSGFVDSLKLKAKGVEPAPRAEPVAVPAFTFPLPAHVDQVNTDELALLDADVRNSIRGALGCLFDLDKGKLKTWDGRMFTARVTGRALELVP